MNSPNFSTAKIAYSIMEACDATSLGKTTIYALIRDGRLKTVRIGRRTLIPGESLQALLCAQARGTAD